MTTTGRRIAPRDRYAHHYNEAKRLIEMAENPPPGVRDFHPDRFIAAAHVHATLALAAATAAMVGAV